MEYFCHIWTEAAQISLTSFGQVRCVYAALWLMNYFPPYNHCSADKTLQASLYCYFRWLMFGRATFHRSTLTAKTDHATNTVLSPPSLLRVSLVRKKFPSNSFFSQTAKYCNRLPRGCFSDLYTILTFPCLELTVIYTNILLPLIRQPPSIKNLPCVALWRCI